MSSLHGDEPESGLPPTLTASGRTRNVTRHLQQQALRRRELTEERIVGVLENWIIRGVRFDIYQRQSVAYMGWVEYEGRNRLMRVAVSMDDQRIITAVLDGTATDKMEEGDWDYFRRHYAELEEGNGT